jgi:hypothetical protein
MNTLEREILIALLGSHQSIYALEKSLRNSNYASVHRCIKKFQEEKLLRIIERPRKDGELDKRKTKMPELTHKGLATLLIEGNLKEEELKKALIKTLQKDYDSLPPSFLGITKVDEIFASTLLRMRPKINLQFFDEKYFNQIFNVSLGESLFENFENFIIPKGTVNKKKALMLKKRYVLKQTMEDFRNLQKTFRNESNKFKQYSKAIGIIIKALNS